MSALRASCAVSTVRLGHACTFQLVPPVEASRAEPLSRWEIACGMATGVHGDSRQLDRATSGSVLAALSVAALRGLGQSPCLVSFSGGFDSTLVLAVATGVARERGLPDPVPVTLRFPSVASTDESSWQEGSIAHLGLSDWVRIDLADELDFLGEIATDGLGHHGLLWPANAHVHQPIFARASGGTVLTGLDGDGLFGSWRWQRARVAMERAAPLEGRDPFRVLLATAPRSVKTAILTQRRPFHASWLRPRAARQLRLRLAREAASEPNRWDERVAWYARRRYLELGVQSLALLASDHDVRVVHPLLDPHFLSALATRGGATGFGTRTEAMRALFGDVFPPALLKRRTKAEFGGALWGPKAREFATSWDGSGLDTSLIDPEQLRHTWAQPNPPLGAATLLQAAWLAQTEP